MEEKFDEMVDGLICDLDKFLENLTIVKFDSKQQALFICSVSLFIKTLRTFKAIKVLCAEGLNQEARALLRVLAETVITLQAIHQDDSESRAERYLAYTLLLDEKILNSWKSNPDLREGIQPEIKSKIQEITTLLKDRYGESSYEEIRNSYCKGIINGNVEAAFKLVGLSVAYDTLYRFCSRSIHAEDVNEYIKIDPDGGYTLLRVDFKGIKEILREGGMFLCSAMELIGKAFKLHTSKEIKKRKQYFQYFSEYKPKQEE
ncbi:MAG: DUF5677 domain-containing protein [bacterium]